MNSSNNFAVKQMKKPFCVTMEIHILIKVQNHQLLPGQGMTSTVSHRIWSMFSFNDYPLSPKITKYMTELKLKQIKIETVIWQM